ncbi:MAG: hypothetical protein IKA70_07975 [Alistipes sp.]|nr:hypothetical protein [Alistipes sp.]
MKQIKIFLIAILGLTLTSCYEQFDEPQPTQLYNDESFEAQNPDYQQVSIATMKGWFGNISNTGNNTDRSDTKYIHFVVNAEEECDEFTLKKGWYREGKYYIKGKVISNDEQGNIYKSLYIFDGTGAIELKLTNGLFLDYPCDLDSKQSMWVYVKITGLYLGNFRMMLSLGDIPTSSYNAWGAYKYYANSNIVSPIKVRQYVFPGEKVELTEGTNYTDDIYVVDKNSYSTISGSNATKFFGRLIRFKGLKVHYAAVPYLDHDGTVRENPALKNGSYNYMYPQWLCTAGIPENFGGAPTQVVNKPWYQLAYSRNNVALYGSLALLYNESATYTSDHGVYTLRTSGYSRFAGKYAPRHGEMGDVLAIYAIYSKQSTYAGGSRDYATYQLSIPRLKDATFKMEPVDDGSAMWNQWAALLKYAEDSFPSYAQYPVISGRTGSQEERNVAVEAWKQDYTARMNAIADDGTELYDEWKSWFEWCVWTIENTTEESYMLPQLINDDDDLE